MNTDLLNRSTGSSNGGVEELGLTSDDHAAVTSELEVSGGGTGVDLANELARGVVDPDSIASAGVDTALGVGVHTIGNEGRDVGKGLAVLESSVLGDVEGVDGGWRRQVAAVETKSNTSISDVSLVTVGRDGDTIGKSEVIGNNGDGAGLEVVAVHLVS